MSGDESYLWGLMLIAGLLVAGFIVVLYLSSRSSSEAKGKVLASLGSSPTTQIHQFPVGRYVAGFAQTWPIPNVKCAVGERELAFFADTTGSEIGRIPRDQIDAVILEDKSSISRRLTVTRIATLGIFALAAPKKVKDEEYCVAIDWCDNKGVRHNTVFEFSPPFARPQANAADQALRQAVLPRKGSAINQADERQCPFCAETIKAAARKCRYCQSDLTPAGSPDEP